MKRSKAVLTLALLLTASSWVCVATAQQATPTASQGMQLSAFGAASGDYTGLAGGRNLGITAGADLALAPYRWLRPAIELRGTYPIHGGTVVSQKDALAGLRVNFLLGRRIHPYGDFLVGRGEMDYQGSSGYTFNGYNFIVSTSYVYSPGAGFDYDFTPRFAVKIDAQIQRWGGPAPTPSGTIDSTVGSIGLVYRFGQHGMP